MEKCRLLYDLWVLFSEEDKTCEIQMVNIDASHRIPDRTDMIESVNSNIEWSRSWEFFEICKVSFGFAVAKSHPLSNRKILTLNDLKGQTVLTLNDGSCEAIANILALLKSADIRVIHHNGPEINLLWESGFRKDVLLVPLCWKDILINATTIPFEKEFFLPYGIFYRPKPHAAVRRFLDFIFATYGCGNPRGIVPILE